MPHRLNNYIEFAEQFSKLTPYDLDHLTDVLLCKLESIGEGCFVSCLKRQLSEGDLKSALTEAMRDIIVELQERRITAAQFELSKMKEMIFVSPTTKAA